METNLNKLATILQDMFDQGVDFRTTCADDGSGPLMRVAYFERDNMQLSVTVFHDEVVMNAYKRITEGMESEVQWVDNVLFSRTFKH